jgi:hypothetical protein
MRQIFVDSRDRVPGGTSTNFSITLPQTLALESGHQGRIDDLRLPVAIPTIYPGHSSIKVRMLSTDYEVFIAEGQYNSGSDLANEIRNALTPINGTWTVTYDARKNVHGDFVHQRLQFHRRNLHDKTLGEAVRLHRQ